MLGASGSESTRETAPPTRAHSTGSPAGCTGTDQRPRTRTSPRSGPEGSHSTASSVRPSRIEAGMDSVTPAIVPDGTAGAQALPTGPVKPPRRAERLVRVALGDEQA